MTVQLLLCIALSIVLLPVFLVITMMAVQALRYWFGNRNDRWK